jgi:hypothetical protein
VVPGDGTMRRETLVHQKLGGPAVGIPCGRSRGEACPRPAPRQPKRDASPLMLRTGLGIRALARGRHSVAQRRKPWERRKNETEPSPGGRHIVPWPSARGGVTARADALAEYAGRPLGGLGIKYRPYPGLTPLGYVMPPTVGGLKTLPAELPWPQSAESGTEAVAGPSLTPRPALFHRSRHFVCLSTCHRTQ